MTCRLIVGCGSDDPHTHVVTAVDFGYDRIPDTLSVGDRLRRVHRRGLTAGLAAKAGEAIVRLNDRARKVIAGEAAGDEIEAWS